tara:strand:- start:4612 stop:5205 length:594 start_codon:yes stop_codon:yes gene_type:complete
MSSPIAIGQTVVVESVPPRKQQVAADVTVNIQNTIPSTTELAFDVSGISCSVLRVSESSTGQVGRAVTLVDSAGNTSTSVGNGVNSGVTSTVTEYPRHFLVDESSSTQLTSSKSSQPYVNGGAISFQSTTAIDTHRAYGFGNNEADKDVLYKTSGIINRKVRPVLTAQDGTVFYEVTTISSTGVNDPITGLPIGRPL